MQLARVIGRATATIKHPSLNGQRLVVLQPLLRDGGADGEPQVAIDPFGCPVGSNVIGAADGSVTKEVMGVQNTPARWIVVGQVDE